MEWGGSIREQLDRDGFVVVPQLLSPQEVKGLADAFDHLLAMARQLPASTDHRGSRFVLEQQPFRLHRVVWAGGAAPELAEWGTDRRFLAMAASALGEDEFVQLIQQAHYKLPHDEIAFRWHQDASNRRYNSDLWRDVNGRGSFVQIAVAVDEMTADNGPLRVIEGSHRLGFIPPLEGGALPPDTIDATAAKDLIMQPGDAVVFGPFVVHGSGPNHSAQSRRLFLQGYAATGANRRLYPGCGTGTPREVR